jgi:capsular exopolysaccharide synthesis family protein
MDLRGYFRVLRAQWRPILLCACAALSVAAAVTIGTTPLYRSTATLFVSTPGTGDVGGAYTGSLFTQQRVGGKSEANAPLDTSLLNVSATDASPTSARRLAQAVTEEFIALATRLENGGNGQSAILITVVRPAELPGAPITPRTKLNLALGLFAGLALGVAAAVARETLDTRVKTLEALGEAAAAPNLAVIPLDAEASLQPLVTRASKSTGRAEALRQLRTNLQFVDVDNPPRSIVVTSAVPGEGKTTTSCNLAIVLAETDRPVVLIEADLRRPRIGTYMGIEGAVGITDVLVDRVALEDALQPWGETGRLHILPSGPLPPNPSELLSSQHMQQLLRRLERDYLVIIDAPPLLPVTDAAALTATCSGALLVVRARSTRREQVKKAAEDLRSVGGRIFGTVFNMAPTRGPDAYVYGYGYGYYGPQVQGRGARRRERAGNVASSDRVRSNAES